MSQCIHSVRLRVHTTAECCGHFQSSLILSNLSSLSVYLFRATDDQKYMNAARAAADFVVAHMYDGLAIIDGVRLSDPQCATVPGYRSVVSGFTVHAFGVLSTYDAQYRDL